MKKDTFSYSLETLLTEEQFFAIHKVAFGKANEEEQILAYKSIVENICGIAEMSFNGNSQAITNFNEGKRWVGGRLAEIIRTDLDIFRKKQQNFLNKLKDTFTKNPKNTSY